MLCFLNNTNVKMHRRRVSGCLITWQLSDVLGSAFLSDGGKGLEPGLVDLESCMGSVCSIWTKAYNQRMARASSGAEAKEHGDWLLEPQASLLSMSAEGSDMHAYFIPARTPSWLTHPGACLGVSCIPVHSLAPKGGMTREGEGNPLLNVLAPAFERTGIRTLQGTALKSPWVE